MTLHLVGIGHQLLYYIPQFHSHVITKDTNCIIPIYTEKKFNSKIIIFMGTIYLVFIQILKILTKDSKNICQ